MSTIWTKALTAACAGAYSVHMNITTKYTTNVNGRSQIVAKGGGKQRTVSYDPSRSNDWNHGAAAGTLLRVHFGQVGQPALDDLMSNITHGSNDSGTVHTFTF